MASNEAKQHIKNLLDIMEENPPEESYVSGEERMIREAEDYLDSNVDDGWNVVKEIYKKVSERLEQIEFIRWHSPRAISEQVEQEVREIKNLIKIWLKTNKQEGSEVEDE